MLGYALYFVAFLGFITDRIFKDYYISKVPEQGFLFLKDFFGGIGLLAAKNYGVAFSLALPQLLLMVSVVIILLFVIYKMARYRMIGKIFLSGTLALIVAGGISNIVDRFIYGGVIDYIKIGGWPIFNIADILIVIGVSLWAWYLITSNE